MCGPQLSGRLLPAIHARAGHAGSVVKPIVMAAALEQGKISTSDTFYCDGYQNFGVPGNMTTIKCANIYGHGMETLAEVIANSCNDAMMQIGAKMGVENFLKAQSTFNFGSRTGIDLPNEGYGIMHTVDTMHETVFIKYSTDHRCCIIIDCFFSSKLICNKSMWNHYLGNLLIIFKLMFFYPQNLM